MLHVCHSDMEVMTQNSLSCHAFNANLASGGAQCRLIVIEVTPCIWNPYCLHDNATLGKLFDNLSFVTFPKIS
jgi:hypothetical protein